jgi:hypothetical protein
VDIETQRVGINMRKEKLLMLYKNLKINGGKEEIILKLEGC